MTAEDSVNVNSESNSFRAQIESAWRKIANVREEEVRRPAKANSWSANEILGHLIDSALNNHQRFVRAALDGSYAGPGYQQNDWVRIHGYDAIAWDDLLEHWRAQNELLCQVVSRIPEERLSATCRIGEDNPVSLRFLVTDYLRHLNHHIQQIETVRDAAV